MKTDAAPQHDHEDDTECPNCALAEKLVEVLRQEPSKDFLVHLKALNMATALVLEHIDADCDDIEDVHPEGSA